MIQVKKTLKFKIWTAWNIIEILKSFFKKYGRDICAITSSTLKTDFGEHQPVYAKFGVFMAFGLGVTLGSFLPPV